MSARVLFVLAQHTAVIAVGRGVHQSIVVIARLVLAAVIDHERVLVVVDVLLALAWSPSRLRGALTLLGHLLGVGSSHARPRVKAGRERLKVGHYWLVVLVLGGATLLFVASGIDVLAVASAAIHRVFVRLLHGTGATVGLIVLGRCSAVGCI